MMLVHARVPTWPRSRRHERPPLTASRSRARLRRLRHRRRLARLDRSRGRGAVGGEGPARRLAGVRRRLARRLPAGDAARDAGEGERRAAWVKLDALHRGILDTLLPRFGLDDLSAAERDHLNLVWHRLDPWPDSVAGLTRLKARFPIATLSNGNVSLLVDMARHGGLPWDCVLSAELFRAYKPSPAVYRGAARPARRRAGRAADGRRPPERSRRGAARRPEDGVRRAAPGARPGRRVREHRRAALRLGWRATSSISPPSWAHEPSGRQGRLALQYAVAMSRPHRFLVDFSSPYSYIASEWIEALAARHGRTVRWHAVLLGVTFQAAELKSPVSHPIKREYSLHDFERSARFAGVPFTLPEKFPVATQNAARVFWWLEESDPERAANWARHCLRAYFTRGTVDLSNPDAPEGARDASSASTPPRPSASGPSRAGRAASRRRATTRSRKASSARRSSSSTASRSGATTGATRSSAGSSAVRSEGDSDGAARLPAHAGARQPARQPSPARGDARALARGLRGAADELLPEPGEDARAHPRRRPVLPRGARTASRDGAGLARRRRSGVPLDDDRRRAGARRPALHRPRRRARRRRRSTRSSSSTAATAGSSASGAATSSPTCSTTRCTTAARRTRCSPAPRSRRRSSTSS